MSMLFNLGKGQTSHNKLSTGDQAPDFTLPDHDNHPVHFADMLGKGPIVLFFYPKDNTVGCTAEVCAFRDSYEAFKEADAAVIGISSDSVGSHHGFVQRHHLPFILLSDKEGVAQKLYGVEKTFGIISERVTYIIDKQGIVRHVFSSQINIDKHIKDALQIIQSLKQEDSSDNSATLGAGRAHGEQ